MPDSMTTSNHLFKVLLAAVFLIGYSSAWAQFADQDTTHHYTLCFPADVLVDCPSDPDIPGVTFTEKGCDLMAVSSNDVFFPATSDSACYKIFRTYRVINWCEYDGEAAPIVVSRDWDGWNGTNPGRCGNPKPDGNDEPGEGICVIVKRDFSDLKADTVWYDQDNNPYNRIPDNPATDVVEGYWWKVISGGNDPDYESYYEGDCSTWAFDENQTDNDIEGNVYDDDHDLRYGSFGYWQYTQHIAVHDQVAPVVRLTTLDTFCTRSERCSTEAVVAIDVQSNCTAFVDHTVEAFLFPEGAQEGLAVTNRITGSLPSLQYRQSLDLGTYRLEIVVNDGCGNETKKTESFVVADCVGPAPICIDEISVELMYDDLVGEAIAEVWATDFIASPIYDCTGEGEEVQGDKSLVTTYSINRIGEEVDRERLGLTLVCSDTSSLVEAEVHGWDGEGNHDFCQVTISVQNNDSSCSFQEQMISGQVLSVSGVPVAGVEIYTGASDISMSMAQITEESGTFNFPVSLKEQPVMIAPAKSTNPFAGISVGDLLRLQRHLLGLEEITNPYERIAADIDFSGQLSIRDLLRMQKVILGKYESWPEGKPWIFLDAKAPFTDNENPLSATWPETIMVTREHVMDNLSFVAIKVGDLDNSSMTSAARSASFKPEINQVMIPNFWLSPGDVSTIDINLNQPVLGAQFSLRWDYEALEVSFQENKYHELTFTSGSAEKGRLDVLFITDQLASEKVGRIKIIAKKAINLYQAITLNAEGIPAFWLDQNGNERKFSTDLGPGGQSQSPSWKAEVVWGNASGELPSVIRLSNTYRQDFHLIGADAMGRVIFTGEWSLDHGLQELPIPNLPAGFNEKLIFWTISSADGYRKSFTQLLAH